MTMKVLCFSLNSLSSYYKDRASNPYDFGVRLTKLATKIHLTISIFILLISFFFFNHSFENWNFHIFLCTVLLL